RSVLDCQSIDVVDVGDIRDVGNVRNVVLNNGVLLDQRSRRQWRPAAMAGQSDVKLDRNPTRLVPVFPNRVAKDWIVVAAAINDAALEAPVPIDNAVVITKVVMAIARPHKESIHQNGVADDIRRGINESRPDNCYIDGDRRVQEAS